MYLFHAVRHSTTVEIPVTLIFEKDGKVTVDVAIDNQRGQANAHKDHSNHSGHGDDSAHGGHGDDHSGH